MHVSVTVSEPASAADLAAYYELRWLELRAPWNQPRGSERDELEAVSRHLMARSETGEVIGVGRIHWNSNEEAQIRYMATRQSHRGRHVGTAIIDRLEQLAREAGTQRIVINARQYALPFYERLGYAVIGDGATLYGVIPHKRMCKLL